MAKALTREDLLYILQSVFKISEQENNAFKMLADGLYVEDYQVHAIDENLHIDESVRQILSGFSISESGVLLYDGTPIGISSKEDNNITVETDGLYVPSVSQKVKNHLEDENVHVTMDDKITWNNALQLAKEFTLDEIGKLVIYDIEIVDALPEVPVIEESVPGDDVPSEDPQVPEPERPSPTTLYLLVNDPDCIEECVFTMHMFLQDKWVKLGITKQTLNKYTLKTELKDAIDNLHKHTNQETLDRFDTNENGELTYDGTNIHEIGLSDEPSNAAKIIDGKLYVKDFESEIKSMQVSAAFSKVNLYDKEINNSGVYELKDYIDNYNLILIEYYYRPNDETEAPGCAKTAVIDTDILNYLYSKNMDYMLEYGYGILMSNSKIRMNGTKLWVDYYHNVCIYRITGIRGGNNE